MVYIELAIWWLFLLTSHHSLGWCCPSKGKRFIQSRELPTSSPSLYLARLWLSFEFVYSLSFCMQQRDYNLTPSRNNNSNSNNKAHNLYKPSG